MSLRFACPEECHTIPVSLLVTHRTQTVPSLFIMDDQVVARQGLKHILREEFRDIQFGEAATVAEALVSFDKRLWDLAVLETHLPGQDAMRVFAEIRRVQPQCRIVILTSFSEDAIVQKAMRQGAISVISKRASRHDLVRAFARILEGRKLPNAGQLPTTVVVFPDGGLSKKTTLSDREHAVLIGVTSGKGSGEIAAEMNVTVQTVSTYRRRIREKLGLKSTADMVRYSLDHRVEEQPDVRRVAHLP